MTAKTKFYFETKMKMVFRLLAIWIIWTILIINNENLNIGDNYSDIFVTVCMVQIMSMLRRTNKTI